MFCNRDSLSGITPFRENKAGSKYIEKNQI